MAFLDCDLMTDYFTERKKGDRRLAAFFAAILAVSLALSTVVDLNPQALRTSPSRATRNCRVINMAGRSLARRAS